MHRFIVEPGFAEGAIVRLDPSEARHATVVLRLKTGDSVVLLDGKGGVANGAIFRVDRHAVDVRVVDVEVRPSPQNGVILAPALTKGRAWDWTLQKAAELEALAICPLELDRCVVRIDPSERPSRQADWQRTVNEAAKQCGVAWIPRVAEVQDLEQFVAGSHQWDQGLVAALSPGAREIGETLEPLTGVRRVALVIGPEGDLTREELEVCLGAGFLPVTLGGVVLRADTAAVAGVAVASHELRRRHAVGRVDAARH